MPLLRTPAYGFARELDKISKFRSLVDKEIKAEKENIMDVSQYESQFKEEGWSLNLQGTLVELSRTQGNYDVRLLTTVRAPTQFPEDEGQQEGQEGEEEGDENQDMREVTVCATKKGQEKTMVINVLSSNGFEISGVFFTENYQKAKENRDNMFGSNDYNGPEIETLSEELFDAIYGFLEHDLNVSGETLNSLIEYSMDSEQQHYIQWLHDLKDIL